MWLGGSSGRAKNRETNAPLLASIHVQVDAQLRSCLALLAILRRKFLSQKSKYLQFMSINRLGLVAAPSDGPAQSVYVLALVIEFVTSRKRSCSASTTSVCMQQNKMGRRDDPGRTSKVWNSSGGP